MGDEIPSVDPDLPSEATLDSVAIRRDEEELAFLQREEQVLQLVRREGLQRYWIKWLSVGAGLAVILFMGVLLYHLVFCSDIYAQHGLVPAVGVALVVAPIVSITTVSVALFVGAFRRFEDKDLHGAGGVASGVASRVFD